jgi:hypothetical protein
LGSKEACCSKDELLLYLILHFLAASAQQGKRINARFCFQKDHLLFFPILYNYAVFFIEKFERLISLENVIS